MLSAEPKAEADNTYRDFDYSGYEKKPESNNSFNIHLTGCAKTWL